MVHITERLALRILQRDKEALRRLAAKQGETMAVVARRLIRQELERHGLLRGGNDIGQEVQDG